MPITEPGQPIQDANIDRGMGSGSSRDRRPTTSGIAQTVRDTAYERLNSQKQRASETLGTVAGAVRGMTQPLRDGGQTGFADYVSKAADGIERWAGELGQRDIADAMRGVQRFARREPAMFVGIAFGVGLLAARFLKSSSNDGSEQTSWQRSTAGSWPTSQMAGPDSIPRVSGDIPSAREAL